MKYVKTINKPAKWHHRTVCDFCGNGIEDKAWTDNNIQISATLGQVYPEGDFRTVSEADCCEGCWTGKVYSALTKLLHPGQAFSHHDSDDYYGGMTEET